MGYDLWDVSLFILGCTLEVIIILPCLIYLAILLIIRVSLTCLAGDNGSQGYFQHYEHQEQAVKRLLAELGQNKCNQFKFVFMNRGRHVKQDEVDSVPRKVSAVWSKPIRFYVKVTGNDKNCHKEALRRLCISTRDIVPSVDECDVILAFIPVVSRAGTDIETALTNIPDIRPAVIVVLHHTFDRDYVAPDSRRIINRSNMLAVDCLFYEDQGLLECRHNTEALNETAKYLQEIKQALEPWSLRQLWQCVNVSIWNRWSVVQAPAPGC